MDKLAQANGVVDEILQLGHVPTKANTASAEEKRLAFRLNKARTAGSLTKEQEAALDKLAQASKAKSDEKAKMEELVQQVRDLGRYPKESRRGSAAQPTQGGLLEWQLAEKLRRARKEKQFSPEQEAELDALRLASQGAERLARRAEDLARRRRS